MTPLLSELITAASSSMQELRNRITCVKYGKDEGNEITFMLDNQAYTACLRGRNAELVLGLSAEADAGIALRALLDGDARED